MIEVGGMLQNTAKDPPFCACLQPLKMCNASGQAPPAHPALSRWDIRFPPPEKSWMRVNTRGSYKMEGFILVARFQVT